MPDPNKYDMEFRTHSYWGVGESNAHIGGMAKGELRRNVAMDLADEGIIDPVISAESLSD